MARLCRRVELAGRSTFFPHALMNLPSFDSFTIRALVSPPCRRDEDVAVRRN